MTSSGVVCSLEGVVCSSGFVLIYFFFLKKASMFCCGFFFSCCFFPSVCFVCAGMQTESISFDVISNVSVAQCA